VQELDKWETVVRWWLISGIVVLGVSAFMTLILIFLCVARSYDSLSLSHTHTHINVHC
jgi:hypothetical protein